MLNKHSASTLNTKYFSLLNMNNLADRIKAAMAYSGVKGTELATACKVTQSSITQWRSGQTKSLDAGTCLRAARTMGISALWLAEGLGQMLDENAITPTVSTTVMPLIEQLIELDQSKNISDQDVNALLVFVRAIKRNAEFSAENITNEAITSAGGNIPNTALIDSSDIIKYAPASSIATQPDFAELNALAAETNKKSPL